MTKKIKLTEKEIALIKKHLSGKYSPFFATKEEMKMMNNLIDRALKLEDELGTLDDRIDSENTDILYWYFNMYKEQQKERD